MKFVSISNILQDGDDLKNINEMINISNLKIIKNANGLIFYKSKECLFEVTIEINIL